MEAIFTVTPTKGKLIPDNRVDLEMYCEENEGVDMMMTLKPLAKVSEKMRMYAFLFGPLMDCAVLGYTHAGYEGMDKVKARYKLEAEFLKDTMYNSKTQETEVYTLDIAKVDKARLLKFIQDVIFFLESELHQKVPDSSKYKMMKIYGKAFTSVKHIKT